MIAVACVWCGIRCASRTRTCRPCARVIAALADEPTYEHGLFGGKWVARGGRLVWVERGGRRAS